MHNQAQQFAGSLVTVAGYDMPPLLELTADAFGDLSSSPRHTSCTPLQRQA